MAFSFDEYYGVLIVLPMIFIICATVLTIFGFIKYIMSKKKKEYLNSKEAINGFIFTVICAICICSIGLATVNINLLFETEEDKIIIQGEITDIKNIKYPAKFSYESNQVTPKHLIIDDVEYYIMYIGDYSIGDNVTIEYLPNSMIVLSIHDVE